MLYKSILVVPSPGLGGKGPENNHSLGAVCIGSLTARSYGSAIAMCTKAIESEIDEQFQLLEWDDRP